MQSQSTGSTDSEDIIDVEQDHKQQFDEPSSLSSSGSEVDEEMGEVGTGPYKLNRALTFGSSIQVEVTKVLPVTITFEDLFYSVKTRAGNSKNPFAKRHKVKKTLLKGLAGEIKPGEVTAIMGPSGKSPHYPSPREVLVDHKTTVSFSCPQQNNKKRELHTMLFL